jgi:hypothetical protein
MPINHSFAHFEKDTGPADRQTAPEGLMVLKLHHCCAETSAIESSNRLRSGCAGTPATMVGRHILVTARRPPRLHADETPA